MARIRQIKKFGGSFGIHLTKEDMQDFKLKEGDSVEIGDIVKNDRTNI